MTISTTMEEIDFSECDGKLCGKGKYVGGGTFICPHNNLEMMFPEVAAEWSPKNKSSPKEYTSSSGKKVWWKCSRSECDCHEWESSISNRMKAFPMGCPYCARRKVCAHNNLEVLHPELKSEWHPDNGDMKSFAPSAKAKVWWICNIGECDCHIWQSTIDNRARGHGCPYCKMGKICKHNNLQISHPHLGEEWSDKNGKGMNEYSSKSHDKVWWKCNKVLCGCHEWKTSIGCRTREGQETGCPYCASGRACPHKNLEIDNPELIIEWDPNNEKPMSSYSSGSGIKVSWICSKSKCGCHIWDSPINRRSRSEKGGCPYCCSRKLCSHNNLEFTHPELVDEWSDLNTKPMNEYTPASAEKVWWKCRDSPCGCHVWQTAVYNRTSKNPRGCPFCSNNKTCSHNSLEARRPDLIPEWHPENRLMKDYAYSSNDSVKWVCSKGECDCHVWLATPNSRTRDGIGSGCPFCTNQKLCLHNNLKAKHPELVNEWSPTNIKLMSEYSPGSSEKVFWVCKDYSNHKWRSVIHTRTGRGGGCPHCAKSRKYSRAQISWLQKIEEEEEIVIQHAQCPEGERNISGVGKVDGYCEETNTIYEYHGDYFHGSPMKFKREDINPTVKKTYGELYDKTMLRDEKIRSLGYNLVIKWEGDK